MKTQKIITVLIAGAVFTAGLMMGFGGYVFAGGPVPGLDITITQNPGNRVSNTNYDSSFSKTKSIGQVRMEVGDILLRYGFGGEYINQVTEALEGNGVDGAELKWFFIAIGLDEIEAQNILLEFDKIGISAAKGAGSITEDSTNLERVQGVSAPGAGGAVPSAAEGTLSTILPSGISPSKRAEPAPATTPPTSLTNTTAVKNIELMQNTIGKIQERLKSCDNADVCDIVERHAKGRVGLTDTTKKAIEDRNWEEAIRLLREVRGIVVGDIELLEGAGDKGSIADVLGLERALLHQTDSALKEMSALKPVAPRKGGFIKLGDLPGKRVTFEDSTTKSIQDLKAAESKEQRENIRKELHVNRQAFSETVQSLRQNLRENTKELRDNFRENVKTTIGHVDHGKTGRIAVAHGKGLRMVNRYRSAIARFDHILGRLESRIEKIGIESEGQARATETGKVKDTFPSTSVILLIEEAKNMQVENEAKLAELQAEYESLLTGENPGRAVQAAREAAKELKSEIENLHAKLRKIADDIKQAAKDYNSSVSNSSSTL